MKFLDSSVILVLLQIILVVIACPEKDSEKESICDYGKYLHEESGKCYKHGEQGPCPTGQFLDVSLCDDDAVICVYKICPKDWRYHGETGKCYKDYQQGPCGQLAIIRSFDRYRNSQIGKCECELEECGDDRPHVYWDNPYRCYPLFDQGPCGEGEWLVPKSNTTARCEKCPCWEDYLEQLRLWAEAKMSASGRRDRKYLFGYKGKCYRTLQEGFPECPPEQKVYLNAWDDHFNIKCSPYPYFNCAGVTGSAKPTECVDGSYPDGYGGCTPIADF